VNGVTIDTLGSRADPLADEVRVDGRRVNPVGRRRYLLLNKPRGYLSTRSDPQGRPTVLALLRGVRDYVYPVGRLDYESEGLLLVTNDGELAAHMTHPRHELERVYEARVRGLPSEAALLRLSRGISLDGRRTAPASVRVRPSGRGQHHPESLLEIVVREGRKRQVRRMCEAVGHPVIRLRRVRIGPVSDRHLKPGQFRELRAEEVAAVRAAVGLGSGTGRRPRTRVRRGGP
jgi:pseudouridine synthase